MSYVREDSDRVDQLQDMLQSAGIPVWRDTANLWPGEDWRERIRGAISSNALVFLACFSRSSLARSRSYQNEELVLAIEQLRQRPPELPWLIPVRFDDCEIPDRDIGGGRTLTSIQRVDLFGDRYDEGARRLVAAILRILGRDPDSARTDAGPAPSEQAQTPTEPTPASRGSRRRAEPDHPADAGIPSPRPTSAPPRMSELARQCLYRHQWPYSDIVQPGGPENRKVRKARATHSLEPSEELIAVLEWGWGISGFFRETRDSLILTSRGIRIVDRNRRLYIPYSDLHAYTFSHDGYTVSGGEGQTADINWLIIDGFLSWKSPNLDNNSAGCAVRLAKVLNSIKQISADAQFGDASE
jgi:hypothetical protein